MICAVGELLCHRLTSLFLKPYIFMSLMAQRDERDIQICAPVHSFVFSYRVLTSLSGLWALLNG